MAKNDLQSLTLKLTTIAKTEEEKIEEFKKFQKLAVGRELKMIGLKK